MIADVHARHLVVVEHHRVAAVDLLDHDFGKDIRRGVGREHPAGLRFERGDKAGGLVDLFGTDLEGTRNLGELAGTEHREMVADDGCRQRVAFAEPRQLQEQALAEVACRHPDGVEILYDVEQFLDLLDGIPGRGRKFLRGGGEVPVVVDAPDEELADLRAVCVQPRQGQLGHQVLLEGFGLGEGVEEELPFRVVVARVARVGLRLLEVLTPLVVEPGQDLEFLLEVQFLVLVRGRVLAPRFDLDLHGLERLVFQRGVLFEFLLDKRTQLEKRDLEKLERLAQLGRQHHLQALLLRLSQVLFGHSIASLIALKAYKCCATGSRSFTEPNRLQTRTSEHLAQKYTSAGRTLDPALLLAENQDHGGGNGPPGGGRACLCGYVSWPVGAGETAPTWGRRPRRSSWMPA